MFRGCISLLTIVGLLASFLAAVPHVHAGMSAEERQEHDASRHFHHLLLGHAHHEHHHDHHDHGDSHHHHRGEAGQAESTVSQDSVSVAAEETLTAPAEEHGICIHGPSPLAAGQPGLSFVKALESQVLIANDMLPEVLLPPSLNLESRQQHRHECDDSGLYLALRHLRL